MIYSVSCKAVPASLETIVTRMAENSVFSAKQRMYKFDNKPNKYLANLLRCHSHTQSISSIKDEKENNFYLGKVINKMFRKFYEQLYASQSGENLGDAMNKFLASVNLPEASEEQNIALNQ